MAGLRHWTEDPYFRSPSYLAELDQVAAAVREGRAHFTTDPDEDAVIVLIPLPPELVEPLLGPMETCDLCRLDWPAEMFESVEWTDNHGEVWERRFCAICRDQKGL
jgi:hypothetical protein